MPVLRPVDDAAGEANIVSDQLDDLLTLGRGRPHPPGPLAPVHGVVAGFARTHPNRDAVESAGSTITYAALDEWSMGVAARLVALGAGRSHRVGVLAEPGVAMVASVLGILRSGAAYVPIHQTQPDARGAELLGDARVTAVVATAGTEGRLAVTGLPVVCAEDVRDGSVLGKGRPIAAVTRSDPAYIIYTSGSTGEPKGVLVEHGQLAASTLARRSVYPGAATFLLVSPLAFDSSVAGLWGTLSSGGRLVVATSDEVSDPEALVALVGRHRVQRMLCVPSLYRVMLDAAERMGGNALASLETVIVAGEPLPEPLVERHFQLHRSGVGLVNEYGPTEATVWASYQRFDSAGPVSIGIPIPGTRLYVLDDELRPVQPGVTGELFIGGAGVAREYFDRPADTARSFLVDPWAGGAAGARMYRTGDLCRWNERGTLDFQGRRDDQVKIRGHRLELGAVEAALRVLPEVRDAVVVATGTPPNLTGYVLAGSDISPESLRQQLADRLPAPMIPARIQQLEDYPLNVNGKVDRARLRTAAEAEARAVVPLDSGRADPDATATARVAAAWAEVLHVPDVPIEVNFFDLGGHSLTMFELQDALERHTGVRPSVVALFRHTTVVAQAALIQGGGAQSSGQVSEMRPAARGRRGAVRARQDRSRCKTA